MEQEQVIQRIKELGEKILPEGASLSKSAIVRREKL